MLLSIIIPVHNEMEYIHRTFDSILQSTSSIESEVIFVDGGSNDGTFEWLEMAVKDYDNCTLITNKKKYVSFGFNLAYPITKGKYVSRLDGHTIYPRNYFKIAIELLDNNKADIVGGPAIHKGKNWTGMAIANCMMHPFGVGSSSFRTSHSRMYVNTVPFAVYKRIVLDNVGIYDEDLIRNQDDELNYRCRSRGYKILMDPELSTTYYVRENLRDLWYQYFSYGIFKPLVFSKVKNSMRLYHIVPALFVMTIPFTLIFIERNPIFFIPSIIYTILILFFSILMKQGIKCKLYSLLVFPCLHFSYGFGFLFGLRKLLNTKKSSNGSDE